MGIFSGLLDPVLNPILVLGPFWAILILSLIISLAITLVYKFATNQKKMKELKDEMKANQKKMKEMKNEPQKLMAMQKEAMKKNMEYMKHSFKATFITLIPILIIFGWMQAHLAYQPIMPGDEFSVTTIFNEDIEGEVEIVVPEEIEVLGETKQEANSEVAWKLKALEEGDYFIDFKNEGKVVSKEVIVSKSLKYAEPIEDKWKKTFGVIQIDYNKLTPLGKFSIFGWQPGWLAWYIVFSVVFSMSLRKILRIY
ncbi:DUF106 domain-containing protein [Candidatus Woesearchaeota archaeon]|nr:DUF106 domain-containing protein [Candidatus Woesearchaeota archaeon]